LDSAGEGRGGGREPDVGEEPRGARERTRATHRERETSSGDGPDGRRGDDRKSLGGLGENWGREREGTTATGVCLLAPAPRLSIYSQTGILPSAADRCFGIIRAV
jgi:hypothetical protein